MKCPTCEPEQTMRVLNSRPHEFGTYRRYECQACKVRFTSIEALLHEGDASGSGHKLELPGVELRVQAIVEQLRTDINLYFDSIAGEQEE